MLIKFPVNIVRLKVYMTVATPMTLTLQVRLKLDYLLTCNTSDNNIVITFKLGMTIDLWMSYNYAHARFDDLDRDAKWQLDGKGLNQR